MLCAIQYSGPYQQADPQKIRQSLMNYIKEIVSLDGFFYVVNINNSIIWMCADCVDLKKDFEPEDLHKVSCGP